MPKPDGNHQATVAPAELMAPAAPTGEILFRMANVRPQVACVYSVLITRALQFRTLTASTHHV